MTGEDRSAVAVFVRARPALTPAELVSAAADVGLVVGEEEVARLRRAEAALKAREVPPPARGRPVRGRLPDESVEAYILRIGAGLRPFEVVRRARMDDVKLSVDDVRRARGVAIVEEEEAPAPAVANVPGGSPETQDDRDGVSSTVSTETPRPKVVDAPRAEARRRRARHPDAASALGEERPPAAPQASTAKARRTGTDWPAMVAEATHEGVAATAKKHKLNEKTLRWWKWKLAGATLSAPPVATTTKKRARGAGVGARPAQAPAVSPDGDVEAALRAGLANLILEHGVGRALEVFNLVVARMRAVAG